MSPLAVAKIAHRFFGCARIGTRAARHVIAGEKRRIPVVVCVIADAERAGIVPIGRPRFHDHADILAGRVSLDEHFNRETRLRKSREREIPVWRAGEWIGARRPCRVRVSGLEENVACHEVKAVAGHVLAVLAAERPIGDDGQIAVVRPHRLADGRAFEKVFGGKGAAADAHVVDVAAEILVPGHVVCTAANHEEVVEELGNRISGATGFAAITLQNPIHVKTA